MAKRKAKRKTIVRTVTKKARSKARSNSKVSVSNTILPAMVYGGLRAKISNALAPITAKVPLGSVADEVVLGITGYMLAKKSKNKFLKQAGMSMLIVESARAGEAVATGEALAFFNQQKNSNSQMESF
jgi:hypothetical protein